MLEAVPSVFSGGFSTMGNTGGTSGFATHRLCLVGSNNITLSGSTNSTGGMTISIFGTSGGGGGGNFSAGISGGNTSGNTGITGTRVVFAGGNNVTLSGSTDANGGTVTISAFNQSTQFLALTLGGNTAGTTTFNASNNASLFLNGGNNITLSGNGSTITISAANQSVQTQGITGDQVSMGVSTGGNTSGNTTVQTGNRFVLAGGNNVTLSVGTGAGSTTVTISAANQTTQSAIKAFGVSNTGQTAGNTGVSTGVDWVLAGSQSITLSQSTAAAGPNTVWIQHPAWLTTADLSQNSSNYVRNWKLTGNTSGTTSSAQGTDLWISGGNSITVSGSSNTIVLSVGNYITTADLSQNSSKYVQNWKLTGNTAGTTSSAQGTDLWFLGGNNITISGSSNTIVISAPNLGAGAMSMGVSTMGNTAGSTGVTGTRMVVVGSNMISLSQSTDANGGTITFNATQTNQSAIKGLGVSNTGNTSGNTGISTGIDWVFAATNNITLSQSTTAGGPDTIWVSGPNLLSAGVSTGGNTSGNSGLVTGQVVLVGGNLITLSGSTNGGSETVTISAANMMSAGMSTNGNTSGNTGFASGMLCLIGGNNVTLSGSTNAGSMSLTISAGNAGGGNFSAGISGGNTSGNTGITGTRVVFAGGNNVTLSGSTDANGGTITISAFNQTTQSAIKGLGVSNTGNTAGNTGLSTGIDFVLAGVTQGAITLSQSTAAGNNTIWFSVPQTSSLSATGWASISVNGSTISIGASTTMNIYAVGNTSGTSSGTVDIRTLSMSAGSGVQVAASNSGWIVGLQQISHLDPYPPLNLNTASTLGQNSLYFVPFDVLWPISASRLNLYVSVQTGMSAANSTGRAGYTISAALYSRGTGASTDRISSFWSMTAGMSVTMNSNTILVATNLAGIQNSQSVSTVATSVSNANATTYMANSMGGYRVIPLPISTNLTPGRYWLAVANSTTSSNAGVMTLNCSVMQQSFSNQIAFRPFGTSSAASDASFYNIQGLGTYNGTSGAFPGSVPLTSDSIRGAITGIIPYFNISGITNSTNVL